MGRCGERNRAIVLARHPDGPVTADCFTEAEGPVPEPAEGEAIVRTLFVTIDPATRGWIDSRGTGYLPPVAIGEPVRSNGVGVVCASRNPDLPEGTAVTALTGWQEHCAVVTDWSQPFRVATAVPDGITPLVIHNIGAGTRMENRLFDFPHTGHFRLPPPAA